MWPGADSNATTQGRGQTQLLEQFRPTRNLFLCGDCFLGESFGLRSDLIPNTAFQHEWKRCQCIHIPTCGSHLQPSSTARRRRLESVAVSTAGSTRRSRASSPLTENSDELHSVVIEVVIWAFLPMHRDATATRPPARGKIKPEVIRSSATPEMADAGLAEAVFR